MEYILAMIFNTTANQTTTLSISGVNAEITQEQVVALMDTIISRNVFEVASGELISKNSAKLTERKITKYEVEA
jgi:hypothetical protein